MTQFIIWVAVHSSQYLIFFYFLAVNSVYTALILLALRDIIRHTYLSTARVARRQLAGEFYYKPVSVIVPAHNESAVISQSVRALLNLHYPEFEVIVVNDGSTDDTLQKLREEFDLESSIKPVRLQVTHEDITAIYRSRKYPNLIAVDKLNGGKADAINAGINVSSFPIFCSIDADSLLEPDALLKSSRLFLEDDSLIATGGIIRILNGCTVKDGAVLEIGLPARTLEAMQVLEYTRAFLSGRTGWNALESLLIISGAFGVFRKDIVIAAGGYRKTVGEDMDLVMRLHRHCRDKGIPYKILFVPDPVCWTQAPFTLKMLLKQRNRWHRGMIDALLANRGMILNPKYGATSLVGLSYFVFVEFLGPLIELFGYVAIPVLYAFGLLDTRFFVVMILLAIFWGISINIGAVFLDTYNFRRYKKTSDILRLCALSAMEFFGYRQIMLLERLKATLTFREKGWGVQDRLSLDGTAEKKGKLMAGLSKRGAAEFLYYWLTSGFFLGTLTLMGPVRWGTNYARASGWSYSQEKLLVFALIILLMAVSLLAARLLYLGAGGARRALARFAFPAAAGALALVSLWFWMNPKLMTDLSARTSRESYSSSEFVFGPYPEEERLAELKAEGYTAVISLLSKAVVPFEPVLLARELEAAGRAGIEVIHIPMLPWVSGNEHVPGRLKEIKARGPGKYYVHCYLGKDRVNVFRSMLAPLGQVRLGGQAGAQRRSLADIPAFERGPVIRLEQDVYLTPYPTDEEYFGYILNGGVAAVASLIDPSSPADRRWAEKEKAIAARYGMKLVNYPWSRLDKRSRESAVEQLRLLPRPLVIHAIRSDTRDSRDFASLYRKAAGVKTARPASEGK